MLERCKALLVALLLAGIAPLQAELLRDPTRPYTAHPAAQQREAAFRLTAIFVSDTRRVAVVNGRSVAVGDYVDGARVVEISPQELKLELRGQPITVRLLTTRLRK